MSGTMSGNLDGKTALITGAASGAGLAAARALAAAGCALHLADGNQAALEAAARSLVESLGEDEQVEIEIHPADLGETVNIEALALECDEVDMVIIAQGFLPAGALEEIDGDDWQEGWKLSFFSTLIFMREMLESQCDRGHGLIAILMTGALEAKADNIFRAALNAALSAVIRAQGIAAAEHGVSVVGIHAGEAEGFNRLGDQLSDLYLSPAPDRGGSVLTLD